MIRAGNLQGAYGHPAYPAEAGAICAASFGTGGIHTINRNARCQKSSSSAVRTPTWSSAPTGCPDRANSPRGHILHESGRQGSQPGRRCGPPCGHGRFRLQNGERPVRQRSTTPFPRGRGSTRRHRSPTFGPLGRGLITVDRQARTASSSPRAPTLTSPRRPETGGVGLRAGGHRPAATRDSDGNRRASRTDGLRHGPSEWYSTPLLRRRSRPSARRLDLITPNETEAEAITGIRIADRRTADEAARPSGGDRREAGGHHTRSTGGAGLRGRSKPDRGGIPRAGGRYDRAGDVFNGALVVALAEGKPLEEAAASPAKPPQSPSPTPERRDRSPRAPRSKPSIGNAG